MVDDDDDDDDDDDEKELKRNWCLIVGERRDDLTTDARNMFLSLGLETGLGWDDDAARYELIILYQIFLKICSLWVFDWRFTDLRFFCPISSI